ncbi:MAG: NAD(P)/FAD-dependent oxidoreductase [Chitinophagales bacterium]
MQNDSFFDTIIIGGGAAGFFTAINLAEKRPDLSIAILERGKEVLQKVKISGGGRCNVTHAEFIPRALSKNYPRGEKALLGPFHTFCTGDMMGWLADRGVETKMEEDGRVFPITDSSQTIIDCFLKEMQERNIQLYTNCRVEKIHKEENWKIEEGNGSFMAKSIVVATGSIPKSWGLLKELGHKIIHPVPSLFTFNIKDNRINDLPGISMPKAQVKVMGTKLQAVGPLLITHWGMSGPAILKLSAWGARELQEKKYNFSIKVNWLYPYTTAEIMEKLLENKQDLAKQKPFSKPCFEIPKRLWHKMLEASQISTKKRWADLSKKEMQNLCTQLCDATFEVKGKSTFKDEFVTAGGVELNEVNFKTFESKIHKDLYLAGEVLNIDAITGGFNFQAAWTGGWMISEAIASKE